MQWWSTWWTKHIYLLSRSKEKQSRHAPASHNPHLTYIINDLSMSPRAPLLKVPPPPKSTTLKTKALTHGPLGTFSNQTIARSKDNAILFTISLGLIPVADYI
jgi:hypothetical protein